MKKTRFALFLISTFILGSSLIGMASAAPLVRAGSAGAVRPAPLVRAGSAGAVQARPTVQDLEARLARARQARNKVLWNQNTGVREHAQQPAGSELKVDHQAKIQKAVAAVDARRAAIDQQHLQEVQQQAAKERAERMTQRLEGMGGRSHFSGPR